MRIAATHSLRIWSWLFVQNLIFVLSIRSKPTNFQSEDVADKAWYEVQPYPTADLCFYLVSVLVIFKRTLNDSCRRRSPLDTFGAAQAELLSGNISKG